MSRVSGNIGTVTTQMTTLAGNYGLMNRLNVLAGVPSAWTHASQGTLHGEPHRRAEGLNQVLEQWRRAALEPDPA